MSDRGNDKVQLIVWYQFYKHNRRKIKIEFSFFCFLFEVWYFPNYNCIYMIYLLIV